MTTNVTFEQRVDSLVDFAIKHDPELLESIRWLDGLAQDKGKSFYDMVYEVVHRKDVQDKAKDWMESKNNG